MHRKNPTHARKRPATPSIDLEPLENRMHFAVHAAFLPGAGRLIVFGENLNNNITVGRNTAGAIFVNGGVVRVSGGAPTAANTRQIQVYGFAGDDQVRLDEAGGPLPAAIVFGGAGNDILTGGSGADQLNGQAGNDFLFGMAGTDTLLGGDGTDSLTGGAGADQLLGQGGDDALLWAPGDGSDHDEGGDGTDTVLVNGAAASEAFSAEPVGGRVLFRRTDPAPFALDIGTAETLSLRANAGDDTFTGAAGLAPLIHLTIDGGVGNDTLIGGDGADDLLGRDGNDFIDGNGGNDLALLGDGDDTFHWDPGDGSDTVEGQNGRDLLGFAGSNLRENFALSPNGQRVRLTRDIGGVTMDLNGLEVIDLLPLGGADTVTVNDLTGTDVGALNLPLGTAANTGDGQPDTVIVNGTNANDNVNISGVAVGAPVANVVGLSPQVSIINSDGPTDSLLINTLGGNDAVDASGLPAGVIGLTVTGGAGSDTLNGSSGDDTFVWNPGDGSDVIRGREGRDTLAFNGSDAAEKFDLSANGSHARFTRDVGGVVMNLDTFEEIDLKALGGADTVTANDQTATGLNTFNVDLDGSAGTGFGDNEPDAVFVNGTAGNDVSQIRSVGNGADVRVNATVSPIPFVNITHSNGAQDALTVNTLGGNDSIDASDLFASNASQLVKLTLVGGPGDDNITGTEGNDTFVWNTGDGSDVIEGKSGDDKLVVNGSDLADIVGIAANGSRVRVTRDFGAFATDANHVEEIDVNARGGPDTVSVGDLTGTDVTEIRVDLAATALGTAGDGAGDAVIVNGGPDGELIPVLGADGGILVNGGFSQTGSLQYFMAIRGVEASDVLQVNGNGGNDTIDASELQTPVTFAADGRAGDDILRGSPFADGLIGGDGNDGIDGNGGNDTAFLGSGDDTFVWDPGDGSDQVEGMNGADTLVFRGSNGGESMDLSANGNRLRLARQPGNVDMNVAGVEFVNLVTLGGPDDVTVNDLDGTDVSLVTVNLGAGGSAAGDLLADHVVVNGNGGDERILAGLLGGAPTVFRPTGIVRVIGADPALDTLTVNALGGNDTVDAAAVPAGLLQFEANGGDGNDFLIGSGGNDVLRGGAGDDTLTGGPGVDTLDGGPGNNILNQD